MASPFKFFRDNSWLLLVIFGTLAIISFTLADFLTQVSFNGGGGAEDENPIVFETRYGAVREGQLVEFQRQRGIAQAFDALLLQINDPTLEQDAERLGSLVVQMFPTINSGEDPQSMAQAQRQALDTYLLVNMAESLGVVVDNDAVNRYISNRSGGKHSSRDIADFLTRFGDPNPGRPRPLTDRRLVEILREELQATEVRRLLLGLAPVATPGEQYAMLNRLQSQASVELLPISVTKLAETMKEEPTEAQIAALYGRGKDQVPLGGDPRPAFKIPYRTKFQFAEGDLTAFAETAGITDEQVRQFYEDNKDRRYVDRSAPRQPAPSQPMIDDSIPQGPMSETPGATAQPTDETGPMTETPGPAAGGETEPATEEPATEEPATEQPAPGEAAEDEPAKPSGDGENLSWLGSVWPAAGLAWLQAEDDAEAEATNAAEDAGELAPMSTKPGQPVPDGREYVVEPIPAGQFALPSLADLEGEEKRYLPLDDELKQEIREELARPQYQDKLEEAFAELSDLMVEYKSVYQAWQTAKKKPSAEPPQPPSLEEFTQKYPFIRLQTTELLSQLEASERPDLSQMRVQETFQPLLQIAYQGLELYDPLRVQIAGGPAQIWKIEEVAARVPTLAEVRSQVVQTWKRQQAFEKAEKLAAEAVKATKPPVENLQAWLDSPAGQKLTKALPADVLQTVEGPTPPFTWQRFNPFAGFSLGLVPGVNEPGEDFMQQVFSLQPNEVAVTSNQPETMVYVARLASFTPVPVSQLSQPPQGPFDPRQALEQEEMIGRFLAIQGMIEQYADVVAREPELVPPAR